MSVATEERMYPVSKAFEMLIGAKPAPQTISRLVKTGQIRASKVLGEWHCTIQDIRDHMEANTTRTLSAEKRAPTGQAKTRSEAKRQRDIEAAMASLETDEGMK
ncbi:MAG: hypothetical protein K9M08_08460 [Pirellula sp.]|nr:hypothetical protein [Pirellula sp.]